MNLENMIIFEDEDFIAVDKPSGLLVIPDRFDRGKENLYSALNEKFGKIWIVHRLDRDTSGITVFAKNPEAHRDLSMKWEAGEVQKIYYALVFGTIEEEHGCVNKPIAPLKKKKGVMVVDNKHGKKAVTNFRVMERFKGFTLVEAAPKTGRTHQIRVHMAAIGHPIAGDVLYNREEAIGKSGVRYPESGINGKRIGSAKSGIRNQERFKTPDSGYRTSDLRKDSGLRIPDSGLARLMLHAAKLSFCHYRKNEMIDLESSLPEVFNTEIMKLRLKGLVK